MGPAAPPHHSGRTAAPGVSAASPSSLIDICCALAGALAGGLALLALLPSAAGSGRALHALHVVCPCRPGSAAAPGPACAGAAHAAVLPHGIGCRALTLLMLPTKLFACLELPCCACKQSTPNAQHCMSLGSLSRGACKEEKEVNVRVWRLICRAQSSRKCFALAEESQGSSD